MKALGINFMQHRVIDIITAVVGAQFGDEGKGKIVDFLSENYDYVVRFNGGTNAGHTVVVNNEKFKFHLLPAGSLRVDHVILGNGMVIDPRSLLEEIEAIRKINRDLRITVSKKAHVVTDLHRLLDKAEEEKRGSMRIGTTFQGIGPAYEDKYARTGIRIEDLFNRQLIKEKLNIIIELKHDLIPDIDSSKLNELASSLLNMGKEIKEYMGDTESVLEDAYEQKRSILFEGANGTLLDIDYGMYPYVTSSNTMAGFLSCGSGFSFRKVENVIGVIKAYMSKVGGGPFPTEINGPEADRIRELGHEYGTTTGRPRRIGWLDIPLLKYSILLNDIDHLAITNVDTLGEMNEIKVCHDHEMIPNNANGKNNNNPDSGYKSFESWGKLEDVDKREILKEGFDAFPEELKIYLRYIENMTGRDIAIVSFGNNREYTVRKYDDLKI